MELQLDLNKRYTYADYLTWLDDKRRELIDGLIKLMSPAQSTSHQRIEIKIASEIRMFLKKKKCQVFVAPFDVRFAKNAEKEGNIIYTVV